MTEDVGLNLWLQGKIKKFYTPIYVGDSMGCLFEDDDICPLPETVIPHGLSEENSFIDGVYREAIEGVNEAHCVMCDGVVGSLQFGVASITFGSDVDGFIIVEDDPEGASRLIDHHLSPYGIGNNVVILSLDDLFPTDQRSCDYDLILRAFFQLMIGEKILPKSQHMLDSILDSIRYSYSSLSYLFFEEQIKKYTLSSLEKYRGRIKRYNNILPFCIKEENPPRLVLTEEFKNDPYLKGLFINQEI